MRVRFLSERRVRQLHAEQVDRFGGDAGIRDPDLLKSAIAQPRATFAGEWLHDFPHGMAAAYLFHLVRNHPFVDGNKRTGLDASLMFLHLNGYELSSDKADVERLVIAIARGHASKDEVVDFFQRGVRPR